MNRVARLLAALALLLTEVSTADARSWAWLGVRIRDLSEQEMDEISARHRIREGFGVVIVDTEEEVLRRANATKFGLAAYFYTRDVTRLIRVAEQLEYGLVGANAAAGYTHEIPFGGFKESGLGRAGGHEGIEEYSEVESGVVNLA